MSRKQFRSELRQLLEADNLAAIKAIWDDLTTMRKETVYVLVDEYQVEVRADGSTKRVVKKRQVRTPVVVERYDIKSVISFMGLAAVFGVGKPPEEKTITVNVNQQITEMSDADLAELARAEDADFRALPAGD